MRGWKNVFHANENDKKAWIAMLLTNKIGIKTKVITKDKEGYYIIKGTI